MYPMIYLWIFVGVFSMGWAYVVWLAFKSMDQEGEKYRRKKKNKKKYAHH
jgi:hypothetical protein